MNENCQVSKRAPKACAVRVSIVVKFVPSFDPASVHEGDHLLDAAARMQQLRVRHLPVVDSERRVVGMVSDRDVRTAVGDPGRAFERGQPVALELMRVADVMSRPIIAAASDLTCAEAAALFVDARIGALPVVDGDDRLVGIVSYVDLLRPLARA